MAVSMNYSPCIKVPYNVMANLTGARFKTVETK